MNDEELVKGTMEFMKADQEVVNAYLQRLTPKQARIFTHKKVRYGGERITLFQLISRNTVNYAHILLDLIRRARE